MKCPKCHAECDELVEIIMHIRSLPEGQHGMNGTECERRQIANLRNKCNRMRLVLADLLCEFKRSAYASSPEGAELITRANEIFNE